jgi:hypothetical protein
MFELVYGVIISKLVYGIIGVLATIEVTLSVPIQQVNAQVVLDFTRGLPSAGFPHNPNGEICGHAFQSAVPFC